MSTLQIALLVLGLGIVAGLLWSSWREKRVQQRMNAPAPAPVSRDWSVKADALPEGPRATAHSVPASGVVLHALAGPAGSAHSLAGSPAGSVWWRAVNECPRRGACGSSPSCCSAP